MTAKARALAFLVHDHLLTPDEAGQALAVAATVLGDSLGRLAAAAAANDARLCAEAAHGLKGNLLNLGLFDLAALAEQAFAKARCGDAPAAGAVCRDLGQALETLATASQTRS